MCSCIMIKSVLMNSDYFFSKLAPDRDLLWLDFAMDGLPLHNSGPTQLWPILMRIDDLPEAPVFVVAIFCGASKPDSVEEYLRPFVTELNQLQSDGLELGGNLVDVGVRQFKRHKYSSPLGPRQRRFDAIYTGYDKKRWTYVFFITVKPFKSSKL